MPHNKTFVRPYRYPEKLLKIYRYIARFRETHGYPPSILEMVDAGFASSTSILHYFLRRMVEEGMIEITPRVSRGIRLIPLDQASPRIQELTEAIR